MDEITSVRACGVFTPRAPTHFANAREDIGDGLLLAMMMNAGARSGLDFEQSAPHRRFNAELGCDRRETQGSRRLRRSRVKPSGADDSNPRMFNRHVKNSGFALQGGQAGIDSWELADRRPIELLAAAREQAQEPVAQQTCDGHGHA